MPTSKKFRWALVCIGLFLNYVTSAAVSSEEQTTETPDPSLGQLNVTTTTAPFQLQIPFRTCYVGESKALKLMVQMSSVLRMLNNDQDYVDSKLAELKKLSDLQKYEMCSDHRIEQLTVELGWVSRRLWELSIRLEEPKDAEVQLLDKRKIDLIRHLQNLRVFTEGSLITPGLAMQLESFDVKVEYLDYGFNTALVMFQTDRPRRPNPLPGRFLKNAIIQSILEPSKSTSDLIEMSRDHPDAMSDALPQLVSNWYDRKLGNVQIVLEFIKRLPKVVHQIIGYAALYDQMSANSDLESYELTELVLQLKGINASVTSTTAADIPRSVHAKYTQLLEDVLPVHQIVGKNTSCNFRNLMYARSIGSYGHLSLYSSESNTEHWPINSVPGTAMFTPSVHQWYASGSDVFSASKRSVKHRNPPVSELFSQWKLVPGKGGKYFKILNAKYDEILFGDRTEMNPRHTTARRLFLARHDYPLAHDYEQGADLWTIDCN